MRLLTDLLYLSFRKSLRTKISDYVAVVIDKKNPLNRTGYPPLPQNLAEPKKGEVVINYVHAKRQFAVARKVRLFKFGPNLKFLDEKTQALAMEYYNKTR